MFLADRHNFGQQVEKIVRGHEIWYRKPRTIYWEWLFFGNTSPLKSIFSEVGNNGQKKLSDYFFNLDVEINDTWLGHAKEVLTEDTLITDEHFYAFGALIAYCYFFGIRDLHKQNLILTKTHLQAVDVEVVFTRLVLPHETLLLPFKKIGYEFAGIGALASSKEELTEAQKEQIFFGYGDLFSLILEKEAQIRTTLSALDFSKIPIRMIIRNTSEYMNFLSDVPENALPSEIMQLERGDIPYYFKYLALSKLFWLKQKNSEEIENKIQFFDLDINRHAVPIADLHSDLEKISATGLLFLEKAFGFFSNTNAFSFKKAYKVQDTL